MTINSPFYRNLYWTLTIWRRTEADTSARGDRGAGKTATALLANTDQRFTGRALNERLIANRRAGLKAANALAFINEALVNAICLK